MNRLIIILLFLLFIVPPIKAQTNDTIFLSREVTKKYYHAVYIEQNRRLKNYSKLLDFHMDKSDIDGYNENLRLLKKAKKIKTKALAGLPKEWIPLYLYKGKYYIYYPSEWGEIARRIITDSTLVYWSMEPPTPEPVIAAQN